MKKLFLTILFALFLLIPNQSEAAIAFDAVSTGDANAGSVTVAHTVSGSNTILISTIRATGGDNVTGVTYDGAAMTFIDKQEVSSVNGTWEYLYYKVAPTDGTNNVVASKSGGNWIGATSASYNGATQGAPVSDIKNVSDGDQNTLVTVLDDYSMTIDAAVACKIGVIIARISAVTGDDWWIIGFIDDSGQVLTAGTGVTLRGGIDYQKTGDSNGDQPPVTDTCTCPGDGTDWYVNGHDHCYLATDCDLDGGDLFLLGNGTFNIIDNAILSISGLHGTGTDIFVKAGSVINFK